MKTKYSDHSLLSAKAGGPLLQKTFFLSVIVALMVALLSASGVFAAPAMDATPTPTGGNLEGEWFDKVRNIRAQNVFYNRIQILPADFEDKDEMALAYDLVHKYGLALKGANDIILKHDGFDEKGHITNELKASATVHALGDYMHTIRAIRAKIEVEGYPIRLK